MLWSCTGVSHTQGVGNSNSPTSKHVPWSFSWILSKFPSFLSCSSSVPGISKRTTVVPGPLQKDSSPLHTAIDGLHWQRWKRQRLIHWWWQAADWVKTENQRHLNQDWNEREKSNSTKNDNLGQLKQSDSANSNLKCYVIEPSLRQLLHVQDSSIGDIVSL